MVMPRLVLHPTAAALLGFCCTDGSISREAMEMPPAAGRLVHRCCLARWMRNGFGTQAVDDGADLLAMGDRDWMVFGWKNSGQLPAR
ncbi:hypothetical protein ACLOJK_038737 [Asimina triloba]